MFSLLKISMAAGGAMLMTVSEVGALKLSLQKMVEGLESPTSGDRPSTPPTGQTDEKHTSQWPRGGRRASAHVHHLSAPTVTVKPGQTYDEYKASVVDTYVEEGLSREIPSDQTIFEEYIAGRVYAEQEAAAEAKEAEVWGVYQRPVYMVGAPPKGKGLAGTGGKANVPLVRGQETKDHAVIVNILDDENLPPWEYQTGTDKVGTA